MKRYCNVRETRVVVAKGEHEKKVTGRIVEMCNIWMCEAEL